MTTALGISAASWAMLMWIAYGVACRDLPLVLPNSVALLVTAFTIAVALRHRRSPPLP